MLSLLLSRMGFEPSLEVSDVMPKAPGSLLSLYLSSIYLQSH